MVICTILVVFYAHTWLIVTHNVQVLQCAFNIFTGPFGQFGLLVNTTKMELVAFLLGRIRTCLSKDVYLSRIGALYRESNT